MAKTNDVMLSHMITYLNDRNWLLREAFFDIIVDVAEVSGNSSLEEYILPLMTQALSDQEENVVLRVLNGLRIMTGAQPARSLPHTDAAGNDDWLPLSSELVAATGIGRIDRRGGGQVGRRRCVGDTVSVVAPSAACRRARFDGDRSARHGKGATHSTDLLGCTCLGISSVQLRVLEESAEDKDKAGLKNGLATEGVGLLLGKTGRSLIVPPRGRTEEDDRFRDRLRSMGMEDEDEVKLAALRSIIRRLSKQGSKSSSGTDGMGRGGWQRYQHDEGRSHPKAVIEPHSGRHHTADDLLLHQNGIATDACRLGRRQHLHGDVLVAGRRRPSRPKSPNEGFWDIAPRARARTAVRLPSSDGVSMRARLRTRSRRPFLHVFRALRRNTHRASTVEAQLSLLRVPCLTRPDRLGVGKASAAVASTQLTATGTMTETSARARALHAAAAQSSAKPTPSGSRASTARGPGGGEAARQPQPTVVASASRAPTTATTRTSVRTSKRSYLDSFRDRPELGPKIHAGVARRKGAYNRTSTLPALPPRAPASGVRTAD